jgi:hypothetical protein
LREALSKSRRFDRNEATWKKLSSILQKNGLPDDYDFAISKKLGFPDPDEVMDLQKFFAALDHVLSPEMFSKFKDVFTTDAFLEGSRRCIRARSFRRHEEVESCVWDKVDAYLRPALGGAAFNSLESKMGDPKNSSSISTTRLYKVLGELDITSKVMDDCKAIFDANDWVKQESHARARMRGRRSEIHVWGDVKEHKWGDVEPFLENLLGYEWMYEVWEELEKPSDGMDIPDEEIIEVVSKVWDRHVSGAVKGIQDIYKLKKFLGESHARTRGGAGGRGFRRYEKDKDDKDDKEDDTDDFHRLGAGDCGTKESRRRVGRRFRRHEMDVWDTWQAITLVLETAGLSQDYITEIIRRLKADYSDAPRVKDIIEVASDLGVHGNRIRQAFIQVFPDAVNDPQAVKLRESHAHRSRRRSRYEEDDKEDDKPDVEADVLDMGADDFSTGTDDLVKESKTNLRRKDMSVISLRRVLSSQRSEGRRGRRRYEGAVDCGTIERKLEKAGMSGSDIDELWEELGNPSGNDKIDGDALLYCLTTVFNGNKDKAEQIYRQTSCYSNY